MKEREECVTSEVFSWVLPEETQLDANSCSEWKGHCGDKKVADYGKRIYDYNIDAWKENALHGTLSVETEKVADSELWRWLRNGKKENWRDDLCSVRAFFKNKFY